ncbi:hypothetical protein CBR_g18823 [Chara braunii]|uniref:Reverse transcriptase domain-containing protein n=1 Tax=Chara braunii TaxID=69332 RepID=A0A388KWQ4_CHABU|nr:hypothetical protein CBR_g18823 [Chara braunii]|eukprot:GBG74412.1 hypothetical protein CBR_g18823 [Chara braunii]
MVDTRSGTSTSPYTAEQEAKVAAILKERREKEAKKKALIEEEAAKMRKIEEEMAREKERLKREEEAKLKAVEEEEEEEEQPLERRRAGGRDVSRTVKASDRLQTIHSRQWRSAKALKGVMDELIVVPNHGVTETQLVNLFYRDMPESLRGHFFEKSQQPTMTYDALSREVVAFEARSMSVSTFWHKDLDKGKKWKGHTISGQVKTKDCLILTLDEGSVDEVPYEQIEWGLEEEDSGVSQGRTYAVVEGGRKEEVEARAKGVGPQVVVPRTFRGLATEETAKREAGVKVPGKTVLGICRLIGVTDHPIGEEDGTQVCHRVGLGKIWAWTTAYGNNVWTRGSASTAVTLATSSNIVQSIERSVRLRRGQKAAAGRGSNGPYHKAMWGNEREPARNSHTTCAYGRGCRPWLDRFVVIYLDDILLFSKTLQEHQGHLRQVLEKLREANFKINTKKCEWAKTQVLYLGHVLDGDGIKPEDSKIAAIRDWPTPRTLTELWSFLGLANYYRKFVRNFSTNVAPLRRLLKKEAIWKWDKDCTSAMKKLKHALIEYPVLKVADPSLSFIVTTDASQYGIGVVLQQDDGHRYRPVEFMSARMPSEKVATSTYERELYALR